MVDPAAAAPVAGADSSGGHEQAVQGVHPHPRLIARGVAGVEVAAVAVDREGHHVGSASDGTDGKETEPGPVSREPFYGAAAHPEYAGIGNVGVDHRVADLEQIAGRRADAQVS